ncbi:MAG: hypothetical protein L0229_02450, partial [Blastocatellia bacterium]|nr:hypothetical protein [Blastocatellia bacterium]
KRHLCKACRQDAEERNLYALPGKAFLFVNLLCNCPGIILRAVEDETFPRDGLLAEKVRQKLKLTTGESRWYLRLKTFILPRAQYKS